MAAVAAGGERICWDAIPTRRDTSLDAKPAVPPPSPALVQRPACPPPGLACPCLSLPVSACLRASPPARQPAASLRDKIKSSQGSLSHLHNKHATYAPMQPRREADLYRFRRAWHGPKPQALARRRNWETPRPTFCIGGGTTLLEEQAAHHPSG